MAYKLQVVSELANQTANDVTRSTAAWKGFLNAAARFYRYSFDDQLLIYAQRPDATVCASMELWNETMRRWVKPGSKGIALIHKDRRGRPSLEYVFDVSDTRPVKGAKTPYLWAMREDHHTAVAEALERKYGPVEDGDIGAQLMELAERAVNEVYRDSLTDLAYDVQNSLLEELDDLNLEVRFRDVLTASVQYTLLTRCGLDPAEFMEDGDLAGITEFSTPAVLHHLGNAASAVSMELLNEIGRAVKTYDREQKKYNKKNLENTLAISRQTGYTEDARQFNDVKHESKERSGEHGTDLHEGGRLPDPQSDDGRTGGRGGTAPGQVWTAEGALPARASQWNVHVDAVDGAAGTPPAGDRPAGAGAGGPDGERAEEAERRGRSDEGLRSNGLGPGGEQLHGTGGGDRAGGDRLQVNPEDEQAAGEQPAVSASVEEAEEPPAPGSPDLSRFSLFPTVEEQIENIAQAQAEEQQQSEMELPVFRVPDDVVDRALTSGGNDAHCIERIVAFFQKGPSNEDAAAFLEKEYGVGGKGVTIAGEKYAMWFDESGIRICPGNSTYGTVAVDIPWAAAAVHISRLLRDGMFASQEKINAAPDNEFRELAAKLWYMRQDFSDSAKEQNLLPTISQHFLGKGFPEDTKEIAELLKTPVHRQQILQELDTFVDEYKSQPDLLRFRKIHDPVELLKSIDRLSAVKEQYKAAEGFIPVKASFITEDEIDQLLMRGGNISESKLRIYAYFKQGHDAKECVVFLRNEYGEGGSTHGGYDESHGSKGIQFTRSDEESGYKGYDTVKLNWNQVQKRVRALIDSGQYLNDQEKAYLPAYEKVTLARRIYHFYSTDPNRTNPPGDMDAAVKKFRSILESNDPEKKSALCHEIFTIMAAVSPDSPVYPRMMPVLRDMEAVTRDEYSLYAPLPEDVLQAERQAKQAAKEAKRKAPAPQRTTSEAPPASGDRLAAAARALAKKKPAAAQEDQGSQFSLFSTAAPVSMEPEPPAPEPAAPPQEPEQEETSRSPWWDGYTEIKEANPHSIVLFQVGDFFEMYGEDAKTAAVLLDLNLTTRPIAGVGRVEMCGVPAHALEQSVEKLREFHSVTLAPIEAQTGERQPSTLPSRQEQTIQDSGEQGWETTVTERNYQATVTAEEAPLLARIMQSNKISAEQFVHKNGDVTFSFAASDRDAVEKLIAKLRAIINKAVADSYPSAKENKPGRTKVELNYRNFAKMFPEIASGEYRYLRMEAGEAGGGMMPLHLEWIDTDVIAVSHTYTVNGDLMRDPEMTFRMDREKGTLEPLTFQQDGSIQIYQQVYPEPGRWIPKLRNDLNTFAQQWLKNISQQGYQKREAVMERDGEDVRLTFDQNGKAVEPSAAPAAESDLGENPTIKEIYEHYAPVVRDMVLADEAYRNACANSDQDLAHLEGNEAIKRAVLTMNDPVLMKQYFDNTAFHNRLHQEIISETYPALSQPQQEQAAEVQGASDAKSPVSMDSPERFEIVRLWGDNGPFGIFDNALERFYEEGNHVLQFVEQGSAENYLANIHRITGRSSEPSAAWVVTPVTLYEKALQILDRAVWNSSLSQHLRDRDLDYNDAADVLNAEMPQLMEAAKGYPDIIAAFQFLPMFREWLVEDILERNYQDVATDPRLAPERYADNPDAPEWARKVPAVDRPEPEQPEAGTEIPPVPETVPEPTEAGAPEQSERDAAVPVEPGFAPNAEEYWNLKAQHPDKLVGVQVGEFMMFYGKDAEEAASALGTKAPVLDIPGVGQTPTTGSRTAWQAVLKTMLEHGKSVVLARPDPNRGPDAPYEIIKERDAAEYIPIGMELIMDGRRMKIESVSFENNKVVLRDLDLRGWFPVFRSETIPYVRESVEDALTSEEYIAAEMAYQLREAEKAQANDTSREPGPSDPSPAPLPKPEMVEIDGGQIVSPAPSNPVQPHQDRRNFQITDDNLGVGGEKTKYQYNVAAIRTLKQIEAEGRLAAPEEQKILSRYVGWGGITKAFDPDDPKWAKEYAELKDLLTPEEYNSARSTVLNAHYARFVP